VLSLQRAERVKQMLVERGVSAERIDVAGRGWREPLVAAERGVDEPRNRRVEVSVR
jgi:outer membrane protein OmpA-like peptidoglycan-associated protein